MKMTDALEDYRLACAAKGVSPKTWIWYEQKLKLFLSFVKLELALDQVEGLQPNHVNRFVEWLKVTPADNGRGIRSSYTIRGYVEVIKVFMSWAINEDLLAQRVKQRVAMPKVEKKIIKTLSRDQFDRLMHAASMEAVKRLQLRDQAILCVLLATGIRASELCGLHVGDVHFAEDYLVVFGKGRKQREVGPLGIECQKALRRYLRGLDLKSDDPLIGAYRGNALTPGGLDQLMKRLRDWAGPEHFEGVRLSAHTLRHTYAVNYMAQGGDIYTLSLLLGHTSVAVTQNYLRDFQQRNARRGGSVLDAF